MPRDPHSIVNDSLERCANQAKFLGRFYELFLDSSEEIQQMFKDTDMRFQKRMLRDSLYTILLATSGSAEANKALVERAERHSRDGLNVRPELYDGWLDCMVEAAREHDPRFDEATEQAWRTVMQKGIDFMVARY